MLLAGANDVDAVVGYLAALAGGHPVVLVPGDHEASLEAVAAAYDPDVVITEGRIDERRRTVHELHPDLALLLSTSGTTGSAKLVRLSHDNVDSNAAAIASPLDPAHRPRRHHAADALLLRLSVINSHLAAGAAMFLTDLSVVDTCFWDAVRRHGVTTFAGVPYVRPARPRRVRRHGPAVAALRHAGRRPAGAGAGPRLRRGRASTRVGPVRDVRPDRGHRPDGLPPAGPRRRGARVHRRAHPGRLVLARAAARAPARDRRPDVEVGELVYEGANVMLGYAESPADLALGRVLTPAAHRRRRAPQG